MSTSSGAYPTRASSPTSRRVAIVHAQPLAHLWRQFVAVTRVHQDQPGGRFDQQRARVAGDLVEFIGGDDLLPHAARDQAKKAAAVHILQAVAQNVAAQGTDLSLYKPYNYLLPSIILLYRPP